MKSLFSAITAGAVMLSAAHAAVINFEGFAAGAIIDDEYAPVATFSTNSNGRNDHAVIFDTENFSGNDDDLQQPFNGSFNPGNILVISEDARGVDCSSGIFCDPPDDEAQGGTITVDFERNPVNFHSVNVFDVTDGASFKAEFFRASDLTTAVATLTAANGIGDNQFDTLAQDIENIVRIVFTFTGSGGIDDLTFTEVPIPGALPLLLSGLALGGFVSRKRKKASA